MYSGFIAYRSSRVHYYRWGSGKRVLLCLHGYGESAASFGVIAEGLGVAESATGPGGAEGLGTDYMILAIDMPFHGQTEWREGHQFTPLELIAIIDRILAGFGMEGAALYLFGYSMGGRVALSLVEVMSARIVKIVLLAPDGLRVNGWYWLATQNAPGNRIFRWTMRHPEWLFWWIRMGDRLGLVNKSILKFTHHYIDDPAARTALYVRWTTMRAFRPNLAKIRRLMIERGIPMRIVYGRFDRVIRRGAGDRFCAKLGRLAGNGSKLGRDPSVGPSADPSAEGRGGHVARVIILPGGHRLLEPSFAAGLVEAIEH